MENLAGVDTRFADADVRRELERCRVEVVEGEVSKGEVQTRITGQLQILQTLFTFKREWRYYTVKGRTPLSVAKLLYADPVGQTDIRVDGHCGCPDPASRVMRGAIWSYHIDTEIGLRLFVDTLRACDLAVRSGTPIEDVKL